MAQMNEKELNRALRTGLPSGVFLFYGSDRYLVERYASLIVDRAVKGDKTFNYERVDGARIDFDHLYDPADDGRAPGSDAGRSGHR